MAKRIIFLMLMLVALLFSLKIVYGADNVVMLQDNVVKYKYVDPEMVDRILRKLDKENGRKQ